MIRINIEQSRLQLLCTLSLYALAIFLSGCDQRPQVIIDGGTVPIFKVVGHGSILVITVNGPDFDNPNSREAGSRYMKPFWQIQAQQAHDIALITQAGGVVYGKVPKGFKQVFPQHGAMPPPLLQGELFTLDLRLSNGEAVVKRFVIHNGKAAVEGS